MQRDSIEELVLVPMKQGILAGIFKTNHSEAVIPVTNTQDQRWLLKRLNMWNTGEREMEEKCGRFEPLAPTTDMDQFVAEQMSKTLLRKISEKLKSY